MQLTLDHYQRMPRQPRAPRYDGRLVAIWLTKLNCDWPTWLVLVLRPLCDECPAADFDARARRLAYLLTLDWDDSADYRLRAAALGIALNYTRRPATIAALAKAKHVCEQLAEPAEALRRYPDGIALERAYREVTEAAKEAYAREHEPLSSAAAQAVGSFPAALLYVCLCIVEGGADPLLTDRAARLTAWTALADAMLEALELKPAAEFR